MSVSDRDRDGRALTSPGREHPYRSAPRRRVAAAPRFVAAWRRYAGRVRLYRGACAFAVASGAWGWSSDDARILLLALLSACFVPVLGAGVTNCTCPECGGSLARSDFFGVSGGIRPRFLIGLFPSACEQCGLGAGTVPAAIATEPADSSGGVRWADVLRACSKWALRIGIPIGLVGAGYELDRSGAHVTLHGRVADSARASAHGTTYGRVVVDGSEIWHPTGLTGDVVVEATRGRFTGRLYVHAIRSAAAAY